MNGGPEGLDWLVVKSGKGSELEVWVKGIFIYIYIYRTVPNFVG